MPTPVKKRQTCKHQWTTVYDTNHDDSKPGFGDNELKCKKCSKTFYCHHSHTHEVMLERTDFHGANPRTLISLVCDDCGQVVSCYKSGSKKFPRHDWKMCPHKRTAIYNLNAKELFCKDCGKILKWRKRRTITYCEHRAGTHEIVVNDPDSRIAIVCDCCGQELRDQSEAKDDPDAEYKLHKPENKYPRQGWKYCIHRDIIIYDSSTGRLLCKDCGRIIECDHSKTHVLNKVADDSHYTYTCTICDTCGQET